MVIKNTYYKTQVGHIIQANDSTETHDVFRCNALTTEHNK